MDIKPNDKNNFKPRFLVFGNKINGCYRGLVWVVDMIVRDNTIDCVLLETDEQGIRVDFFDVFQQSTYSLNYTLNRSLFSANTQYVCYNLNFNDLLKYKNDVGYVSMARFLSLVSYYKFFTYDDFIAEYVRQGVKKKDLLSMAVVLSRFNIYR